MTEGNEESNHERTISTEVEEEERVYAKTDDPEEPVTLDPLEVQLEDDHESLVSEGAHNLSETHVSEAPEDEATREEEDCPFCDYMRLGPCGDSFSAWEKCTEAAEEDGSNVFEKCNVVTEILTACMHTNLSYYGPVLGGETGIEEPLLEAEAMERQDRSAERNLNSTEKPVDLDDEEVDVDD